MWRLGGKIIDQRLPPRRGANERSRDNKDEPVAERERVEEHMKPCRGLTGQMK